MLAVLSTNTMLSLSHFSVVERCVNNEERRGKSGGRLKDRPPFLIHILILPQSNSRGSLPAGAKMQRSDVAIVRAVQRISLVGKIPRLGVTQLHCTRTVMPIKDSKSLLSELDNGSAAAHGAGKTPVAFVNRCMFCCWRCATVRTAHALVNPHSYPRCLHALSYLSVNTLGATDVTPRLEKEAGIRRALRRVIITVLFIRHGTTNKIPES